MKRKSNEQHAPGHSSEVAQSDNPSIDPKHHLGSLPAELRVAVYELALKHPDGPLEVRSAGMFDGFQPSKRALTQVSRAVRQESLPIYLSMNTFHVSHLATFGHWLKALGPSFRFLRTIELGVGVIEGRRSHKPESGDIHLRSSGKPSHISFSITVSSNASTTFTTEDDVDSRARDSAVEMFDGMLDAFLGKEAQAGEYAIVVRGMVGHCEPCSRYQCDLCVAPGVAKKTGSGDSDESADGFDGGLLWWESDEDVESERSESTDDESDDDY